MRPRIGVLVAVAVAVLTLDIVSKTIVVATLSNRPQIGLLGGFVTLLETRNPGAAFSLGGPSETIVFTAIAVGVVIFIVRAARRIYSIAWAVALGLLLGGATGNLTDRIFRSPGLFRGWVVDWIEVPHWPVFNLADSAITCGGVLMVVLAVLGRGIEGKPHRAATAAAEPPGPANQPEETSPESADRASQSEEPPLAPEAGPEKPVPPAAERAEPDQTTSEQVAPEQTVPKPAAAEEPVAERAQPEWPEAEQPQSQWPRSEWSEPEESRQEHPARGSGG